MTKERVVYSIVLGVPTTWIDHDMLDRLFSELDGMLTQRIGGVTRYMGVGTWTAGSAVSKYAGEIERDISVTYVLSLMPDFEEQAFCGVRDAIRAFALVHKLPLDWIHVNRTVTEERIFRIVEGCGTCS